MSVKAYVLTAVEAGLGDDVIKTLSAIEEVTSAYNVTGPYDVIAPFSCSHRIWGAWTSPARSLAAIGL